MALINCSECGKEISNKAGTCVHCGTSISKPIYCEECHKQIDANADMCTYCGCPIQKPKKEITPPKMKTCKSCGTEVMENAITCYKCSGDPDKARTSSFNTYTPPPFAQNYQPLQVPPRKPQKPWYKRIWVWVLIVFIGLPTLSGIIGGIAASEVSTTSTETSLASSVRSDSSSESSREESEESTAQNDIDEKLLKIIQYHKDKMNGTESEAALKGSETAFNLNLGLYKSNYGENDLKYLTYYYALKGEQEYKNEIGYDNLNEVRKYVKALDTEGILEKAFEEPKLTLEQFQELAESPTFEELSRYPDTYKTTPIKVTVYVKDVDTDKWLGLRQGGYLCTMNGQEIVVFDNREIKEPRLLQGDTVTIYGFGGGLYTRQKKQQGLILDKTVEEWYSPEVRIEYVILK